MPTFPGVELRSRVAGPSRGVDISAQQLTPARGVAALGQGIADVGKALQKRAEQEEVSRLNKELSETQLAVTLETSEAFQKADSSDKSIANNIGDRLNDTLAKMRQGINTQAGQSFFDQQAVGIRSAFAKNAAAGQAQLAAENSMVNYVSGLSAQTAILLSDPTDIVNQVAKYDAGLEAAVASGLPRKVAIGLESDDKKKLYRSEIRGWIRLDPHGTKQDLIAGKWDDKGIDGDLKSQLIGKADTKISGDRIEAKRVVTNDKRILKDKREAEFSDVLFLINAESISVDQIHDRELSNEQKITAQNLIRDKGAVTDNFVKNQILRRVLAPEGTQGRIINHNEILSWVGKGLSVRDYQVLRGEMLGAKTPEGKARAQKENQLLTIAEEAIVTKKNDRRGIKDPMGETILGNYMNFMFAEKARLIKEGVPESEWYDSNSKNWLGKSIVNFARSRKEIRRSRRLKNKTTFDPSTIRKVPKRSAEDLLGEVLKGLEKAE